MTLLLTGGSGMLGSALQKFLLKNEISFMAPTRKELDCRDFNSLHKFITNNQVTTILHCAAKVGGIKANLDNPSDYLAENLQVDSVVLGTAKKCKVSNLLYMSSSCAYPIDATQPFKEYSMKYGNLEPSNRAYAVAKLTALELINSIRTQFSLNFSAIILSNLYGPNDDFHSEKSHLVAAAIRKCKFAVDNGNSSVEIWGTGNARREFTYVEDVAEWIANSLTEISKLPVKLNLGYGRDYSVRDFYETAAKTVGYTGNFKFAKEKPEGMQRKLMDSTLARESFGWNPKTSLESGMAKTFDWWKESRTS